MTILTETLTETERRQRRAYDRISGWMGPVRLDGAEGDRRDHLDGIGRQGGISDTIIVRRDPECPGRCVDLHGEPVWPPHGHSTGTARWR